MTKMIGTKTRQLQRSLSPVRQQATQIYTFSSVRNSGVSAFTSDSTAANLPIAYAPWQSSMDTALPTWGLVDPVMAAIERDGFFLVNSRSSSKIRML
jgi:Na+/serine symporter